MEEKSNEKCVRRNGKSEEIIFAAQERKMEVTFL